MGNGPHSDVGSRGRELIWERIGNDRSCADAAFKISLSQELRIGIQNRESGNAELRGKHTG